MSDIKARLRAFNWPVGLFVIGYHVALLVGLPFYFYSNSPSLALIVVSVGLLFLTEIGIGAAYHRFYSHRCYKLSKPAEMVLLFLATLATQGSALRWSYDHRLHHAHVDTDDDPYCIKKGFWYAHMLWLFEWSVPMDMGRVRDLAQNKLVMLQHRIADPLSIVSNLVVCGFIGWMLDDFLGAFVIAWWTRMAISHHLTWLVNSLAHYWGEQTYSREHSAFDNYLLAFLTVGEGYHNYHHTFPGDYRNGVRWYHFDPTKWTIWTLSRLGLASDLKWFNDYRIKKRLIMEDRKRLLADLGAKAHDKKVELEQRVEHLVEVLQEKLTRLSTLAERIRQLKQNSFSKSVGPTGDRRSALRDARCELKALSRSMKQDWHAWCELCSMGLRQSQEGAL